MQHFELNMYSLYLLASVGMLVFLAAHIWRQRPAPGSLPFAIQVAATAAWSLAYALEVAGSDLETKLFWAKAQYLGIGIVPLAWLGFAAQYSGARDWLSRRRVCLFSIIPIVTLVLAATNETHHLIWRRVDLPPGGRFLQLEFGYWFWVSTLNAHAIFLLGTLRIFERVIRSRGTYQLQAIALLLAAGLAGAANFAFVYGINPFSDLDPTPFAYSLSGLIVTASIFRLRLLDLMPVAREALFEGMSDGAIALDTLGRVVDLNQAARRIVSRSASQAIGEPLAALLPAIAELSGPPAEGRPVAAELALGDGASRRLYDVRVSPLNHRRGGLAGSLIVLRDQTQRRKTEEALRQSDARLRIFMEKVPAIVWAADTEGRFTFSVGTGLSAIGFEPSQLIGLRLSEFAWVGEIERTIDAMNRALRGEPVSFVQIFRGRSFRAHIEPVHDHNGRITGCVAVALDITELRQVEERLEEYAENLERLSRKLIEAQELERRQIARELHDELGQCLTAVKIDLERAQRATRATITRERLQESIEMTDRAIQTVRDLSLNLRPSMLDDLGLPAALHWYLDRQARRGGFTTALTVDPSIARLPQEVETACFRITQEAVNNVVRHAHAQSLAVQLKRDGAELELVIRDDGIGFDSSAARARAMRGSSLGLLGMEERAALVGGYIRIASGAAGGTEVRAHFPLAEPARDS